MYILKQNDGSSYLLENKSSYIIGRRNADIIVSNDSISRNHTKINIRDKHVYVEDLKSSNKTFLNGKALKPNIEEKVPIGSEIVLGLKGVSFKVTKDLLVTTSSGLSTKEKQDVKNLVNKMGGVCIENWSAECTHLVVNTLTCTLKVMCALISKSNIILVNYLKDRCNAMENKKPLPDPINYRPNLHLDVALGKKLKVDFDVDRTKLFDNKIFVFQTDDDLKKIKDAVVLAGGKTISFSNYPVKKTEIIKSKYEYLFITTPSTVKDKDSTFNSRIDVLVSLKRRPIPIQEIALAVISNKCDIHCNSKFNKIEHMFSAQKVSAETNILVPETQSMNQSISPATEINSSVQVVPGTFESNMGEDEVNIDSDKIPNSDNKENKKRSGDLLPEKVAKIPKLSSEISSSIPMEQCQISQKSNIIQTSSSSIKPGISEDNDNVGKRKSELGNKSQENEVSSGKRKKIKNPFESVMVDNVKEKRKPTDFFKESSDDESLNAPTKKKKFEDISGFFNTSQIKSKSNTSNISSGNSENAISELKTRNKNKEFDVSSDSSTKKKKFGDISRFISTSPNKDKSDVSNISSDNSENVPLESKTENKKKEFDIFNMQNNKSTVDKTVTSQQIKNPDTYHSKLNSKADNSISNSSMYCGNNKSTVCVWLDKTTKPDESSVSFIKQEEEELIKAVAHCFMEALVIVDNSIVKRSYPCEDIGNSMVNTGCNKPNFKRFKKNQPLHYQTRIIPMSTKDMVVCGATGIVERFVEEEVDEPEEDRSINVVVQKKKKFVFEL